MNKLEYVSLARRIGLDAAVSPRLSAANAILREVRSGSVTRVATFKDTDAESDIPSLSSMPPWMRAALDDAQIPIGGSLRKFLWRHGADSADSKARAVGTERHPVHISSFFQSEFGKQLVGGNVP